MAAPEHVVVVGAGMAGARAVQELRSQGHAGRVTLVGAEPHLPYDRPPLSKELLSGAVDDTTLEVAWDEFDVALRLGVRATGLRQGVLQTDEGPVPYDGLVLATGARAQRLGGGGVLRTVDEARALRTRLRPGARVVIVGAGWIGAEVATAASAAGCLVVVVEAAGAPLAGALGEDLGGRTLAWYAAAGVDVRLHTRVAEVAPDGVVLAGGERLPADAVLVGVGARPDTDWLAGSGVDVDRGVLVDEHLATSLPGVVAAGDCAAWHSPLFGTRLRVEHWDDALHAPAVAVTTLLGGVAVHDPVPYFWSDQFGHRLQYAGHAAGADRVVERGGSGASDVSGDGGWSVCWLRAGVLVAVLAVDRPRDLVQGRRLIGRGHLPDPVRLADPAVALRDT